MKVPTEISEILELAGKKGSRPFDRLERGTPVDRGRPLVAGLPRGDLDTQTFLFLQGALYLYFDCWDEAHNIAQDHEGAIGNWMHAIVHRREPDAGNSKYWYARVRLPVGVKQSLAQAALETRVPPSGELEPFFQKIARSGEWEPEAFVDLCQSSRSGDPIQDTLLEIQRLEWNWLLNFILGNL